jgi:hypothetical protein
MVEYLENEARSPIAQGAFLLSKTHLIKRGISAINVLTRRLRFWQLQNAEIWTKAEQARFHHAQGYHLQRQGDPAAPPRPSSPSPPSSTPA